VQLELVILGLSGTWYLTFWKWVLYCCSYIWMYKTKCMYFKTVFEWCIGQLLKVFAVWTGMSWHLYVSSFFPQCTELIFRLLLLCCNILSRLPKIFIVSFPSVLWNKKKIWTWGVNLWELWAEPPLRAWDTDGHLNSGRLIPFPKGSPYGFLNFKNKAVQKHFCSTCFFLHRGKLPDSLK